MRASKNEFTRGKWDDAAASRAFQFHSWVIPGQGQNRQEEAPDPSHQTSRTDLVIIAQSRGISESAVLYKQTSKSCPSAPQRQAVSLDQITFCFFVRVQIPNSRGQFFFSFFFFVRVQIPNSRDRNKIEMAGAGRNIITVNNQSRRSSSSSFPGRISGRPIPRRGQVKMGIVFGLANSFSYIFSRSRSSPAAISTPHLTH